MTPEEQITKMKKAITQAIKVMGDRFGSTEQDVAKAREVIRLALKYNLGIGILLPERLFPPRFVTIASSNYDDTVEYPINQEALAKLQAPDLTTEEFHRVYRELTSVPLEPKGRY
ncbi:MAG: hypothetical protein HP490_04225 [Nitrospira sp.]|nr:hypothetical protein [Nitrospira sp.]